MAVRPLRRRREDDPTLPPLPVPLESARRPLPRLRQWRSMGPTAAGHRLGDRRPRTPGPDERRPSKSMRAHHILVACHGPD